MTALSEQQADAAERRIAQRRRVLKRARVVFNGGFSTIDCIVRNISSTGALLTLDQAVHLPSKFEITIGEDPDARPAKLVYRRAMFAGIRFLDLIDEDPAAEGNAALMHDDKGFRLSAVEDTGGELETPETGGVARASGHIRYREPEALPPALRDVLPW